MRMGSLSLRGSGRGDGALLGFGALGGGLLAFAGAEGAVRCGGRGECI